MNCLVRRIIAIARDMSWNNFTGTVPREIKNYKFAYFDLGHNNITGCVEELQIDYSSAFIYLREW